MKISIHTTRRKTTDRTYTTEKLGKKQSLTPEGFLLCEEVPIARTGTLLYGDGETPVEAGKDGIVKIHRDENEVFRKETLASFEGKPVTNDHPDKNVDPENFKEHVVGIVQNVRRGEGADNDLMLADLIIHDKDAIDSVRDGKREVSCGYDADYEQIEAGRGRQLNIMGNHVALVENGRCGSRCAIQDGSMSMKKKSMMDALLRAFKAKDAMEVEKIAKDMETGEEMGSEGSEANTTHVHVHVNGEKKAEKGMAGEDKMNKDGEEAEKAEGGSTEERLARLEALMEKLVDMCSGEEADDEAYGDEEEGEEYMDEEAEPKADNKEDNAKEDEKATKDARARLEILVPGAKFPVHDSRVSRKKTRDTIYAVKRKALDTAFKGDHRQILKPLLASVDLRKASYATIDALFVSSSELVKAKNNAAGVRSGVVTKDNEKAVSIAEINKKARDAWSARGVI